MKPTTDIPFPVPDLDWPPLQAYWAAAANGELRLPRCRHCGRWNWYPEDECLQCASTDFDWPLLSGRGRLFSWAWVKRPLHKPYAAIAPYVGAVIELDEAPGLRLVSRMVDCEAQQLSIDAPVHAVFRDLAWPAAQAGVIGPLFRLA